MAFRLFSSVFAEGRLIPELHTCEGADLSPPLEWSGEPPETRSYALIVEDPDAPAATAAPGAVWCHWLLFNVAARIHVLPQGWRPGSAGKCGVNDFGSLGYGGPCPPKGHGPHRYFFKLSALDLETLDLSRQTKRLELLAAIKGHVLAEAQYMGRFERR